VKSHEPFDTGGSATQIITCFLQVQNSNREDPGYNTCRMRHDVVNILAGSIHTVKKSTKALVVTSKEIGVGVNVEKNK